MTLMECSHLAGLHADHLLVSGDRDGTHVVVSVHGHGERKRQLVQEIAASIVMVHPQ